MNSEPMLTGEQQFQMAHILAMYGRVGVAAHGGRAAVYPDHNRHEIQYLTGLLKSTERRIYDLTSTQRAAMQSLLQ